MEVLLLIGCLGSNCEFGATQQSFPTMESCQQGASWLTGTYSKDRTFFSQCFGTANRYTGPKNVFGCAFAVKNTEGVYEAISIPCVTPLTIRR